MILYQLREASGDRMQITRRQARNALRKNARFHSKSPGVCWVYVLPNGWFVDVIYRKHSKMYIDVLSLKLVKE